LVNGEAWIGSPIQAHLTAPFVNVGSGAAHEVTKRREALPGAVAVLSLGFEPFTIALLSARRAGGVSQRWRLDRPRDQFDSMGDGLRCDMMAQLDYTSSHSSFLRVGIDAAFLWR
jgi:hypothetical protein